MLGVCVFVSSWFAEDVLQRSTGPSSPGGREERGEEERQRWRAGQRPHTERYGLISCQPCTPSPLKDDL